MLTLEEERQFLPEQMRRELREKRKELHDDAEMRPDYKLRCRKVLRRAYDANAIHSWWLEHPEMYIRQVSLSKRKLRRHAEKGIKKIRRAYRELHGREEPLRYDLNHETLLSIGENIDDRNDSYRTDRVTLGLREFTPPNPLRVTDRLDELFVDLKNPQLSSVEAAIYAHIMIAGIQPFIDGNKRTARVVQTRILEDHHYPPGVVPMGERDTYLLLLEKALSGSCLRGDNVSYVDEMRPLFVFIAGKVNRAFDKIMNKKGAYTE